MAKLRDVPGVVKKLGVFGLARRVWQEVTKDDVFTWSAALAYAWIFAIFPFLIFMLTLAPYLPGQAKERAMEQVQNVARNGVGGQGGEVLVKSIHEVMTQPQGGLLSIGLILALWSASGGMSMTMNAVDRAYGVACSRSFVRQRLTALGLTLGTTVLILLVLFLLPIGTQFTQYLKSQRILAPVLVGLIDLLRYAIAIAMLLAVVGAIYYFGPCIHQKWHAVTPGAIFTVVVWIVLGFAFSYYVANFGNFNKTYGTLGGAVALLLFFYIDAVVLLVGAEVNSVIDFETLGVRPGTHDFIHPAVAATAAARPSGAPGSGAGGGRTPEGSRPAFEFSGSTFQSRQDGQPKRRRYLVWVPALLMARWGWNWLRRPVSRPQTGPDLAKHRAAARPA